MSDDKCELFTAKWMISSRLNAGVSLLGAADSNQRYAPRSIIKQGFPCKRQIYWILSQGGGVFGGFSRERVTVFSGERRGVIRHQQSIKRALKTIDR